MTTEQIRLAAQRDEQQRETERQARLVEAQRLEREQRALEREAQRARDNTPEAQAARERDDKRFSQAVAAAATGEADRPTRSYRSEQEAREQTAEFTHLKDAGVVLLKDWMHDNPAPSGRRASEEELAIRDARPLSTGLVPAPTGAPASAEKVATWHIDELTPNTAGRAEAWQAVLVNDGYIRTSEVRSTVDEQGIRRAEFDMRYRTDQPEIALIHAIVTNTNARAAAGQEKYAGVRIEESEQDRAERRQAAGQAELQPRTGPTPERDSPPTPERLTEQPAAPGQGAEKKLVIEVDELMPVPGTRGQAEAVKEAIEASGARAGTVRSSTNAQGVRHSELQVSCRTDQPELAGISHTLDAVAAQPGSHVNEHSSDRAVRHELARGQEAERLAGTPEITR